MKQLMIFLAAAALLLAVGCSDDDGPTANEPVNTDAPVLATIGAQTVFVDSTMALDVSATDADSTIPLLSAAGLPAGATFTDHGDGTGTLTWTPSWEHIAVHTATVYATDADDASAVDSERVAITVIPAGTATSSWNIAGSHWESVVNGSSYDSYMAFSFAAKDTVTGVAKSADQTVWDLAFRREVIKTNGTAVLAADLGFVDYDAVTIADTTGASWQEGSVDYFIDTWYNYNPQTHELTANQYVYSMVDAEGDNYVKFRVDSIVGAGFPPDMGTVHITYFYQGTASSTDLSGTLEEAAITVGPGTGYFDFSTGTQVTPADPSTSTGWDIAFSDYNCMQNSGPNGPGQCAAFPAYGELVDPTDIAGFTAQPAGAPLFPDIPESAMTEWYDYNPQTHQLTSKSHVYLIMSSGLVYKMRIDSYYMSIGGLPASGYYTFIWQEL